MNTNNVVIVILIMNSMIISNNAAGLTKSDEMRNQAIAKVLPEEYANYEKELKGDSGLSDTQASFLLVSKAKALLGKPAENTSKEEEYNRAYYATWHLCLRMRQNAKDPAVQKLILDQWDSYLREDDKPVPFQIYALTDRSLLTGDFWKLLQQTKRKKTISAICYVLYHHGDREDAERLTQKRKSGIDVELQEIIQNAINWMNYRLSGDKTNPGPAAAPPKIDIKDPSSNEDTIERNADNKPAPTRLDQVIRPPMDTLFQWPAPSVLNGPNRVDNDAGELAWPKKQCTEWLNKVIAKQWLPDENPDFIFIRDELEGRDVVRATWEHNDYRIEVSQTASIFATKVSPLGNRTTGMNRAEKIENAKRLCLEIFNKTCYRWSADGDKVQVKDLNQKIATYSFRPELVRHLKDDKAVCGRPQTINEAGVKQPQNDVEALREMDPNNPNWDKTASSYSYWFRMVNWWNDGKSIGFYFLKVEEGAWIPSYFGDIDKNFFKK